MQGIAAHFLAQKRQQGKCTTISLRLGGTNLGNGAVRVHGVRVTRHDHGVEKKDLQLNFLAANFKVLRHIVVPAPYTLVQPLTCF
jgi:hypothetical protein